MKLSVSILYKRFICLYIFLLFSGFIPIINAQHITCNEFPKEIWQSIIATGSMDECDLLNLRCANKNLCGKVTEFIPYERELIITSENLDEVLEKTKLNKDIYKKIRLSGKNCQSTSFSAMQKSRLCEFKYVREIVIDNLCDDLMFLQQFKFLKKITFINSYQAPIESNNQTIDQIKELIIEDSIDKIDFLCKFPNVTKLTLRESGIVPQMPNLNPMDFEKMLPEAAQDDSKTHDVKYTTSISQNDNLGEEKTNYQQIKYFSITCLRQIKELHIQNVDTNVINIIAELENLVNLSISYSNKQDSKRALTCFYSFAKTENEACKKVREQLKSLSLSVCFCPDDLSFLNEFSTSSIFLMLQGRKEDENFYDLDYIKNIPSLKKLFLIDLKLITLDFLNENKSITELKIENCSFLGNQQDAFAHVFGLTQLESLSLGGAKLRSQEFNNFNLVLERLGKLSNLKRLELNKSIIDFAVTFPQLEDVALVNCTVLCPNFLEGMPVLKSLKVTYEHHLNLLPKDFCSYLANKGFLKELDLTIESPIDRRRSGDKKGDDSDSDDEFDEKEQTYKNSQTAKQFTNLDFLIHLPSLKSLKLRHREKANDWDQENFDNMLRTNNYVKLEILDEKQLKIIKQLTGLEKLSLTLDNIGTRDLCYYLGEMRRLKLFKLKLGEEYKYLEMQEKDALKKLLPSLWSCKIYTYEAN